MSDDMRPDSGPDTQKHIDRVRALLGQVQSTLKQRAEEHDASKLGPEEKPYYDDAMSLWGMTYGSPEYKAALARLGPALEHHYKVNRHHPEHFGTWRCVECHKTWTSEQAPESPCFESAPCYGGRPRFCPDCCPVGAIFELTCEPGASLSRMTLLDLVEMLADWKAATERHENGSLARSIEINAERFHYGEDMKRLLTETAKQLSWL